MSESDSQAPEPVAPSSKACDPPTEQAAAPKKACCTPSAKTVQSSGALADRNVQSANGLNFVESPTRPAITHATGIATEGLILIEGASFDMGTESDEAWKEDGEGPVREVSVNSFYISPTAVTNEQFSKFMKDSGYVTEAEKFGWSFVFHTHLPRKYAESLRQKAPVPGLPWWIAVPGARWDRPFGDRSSIKKIMNHPVVHVSWNDAVAYCEWAGARLPYEVEWEYAARGGKAQKIYPWGDQLEPLGKHKCNIWQGRFPEQDSAADGYDGTCPVDAFEPNGYGLFNVSGNVWEWITEWFDPTWHVQAREETRHNPRGPISGHYSHKLQRGGSYLCHNSYCNRYRVAARTGNTPDSATTNNGFRIARDVD